MNTMRRLLMAGIAALAVVSTAPAWANMDQTWSGNEMSVGCHKGNEVIHNANPLSVTRLEASAADNCMGVIYTSWMMAAGRLNGAQVMCPDGTLTLGQVIGVVVRYMDQHPERLNLILPELALSALKEAWPCNKPMTSTSLSRNRNANPLEPHT